MLQSAVMSNLICTKGPSVKQTVPELTNPVSSRVGEWDAPQSISPRMLDWTPHSLLTVAVHKVDAGPTEHPCTSSSWVALGQEGKKSSSVPGVQQPWASLGSRCLRCADCHRGVAAEGHRYLCMCPDHFISKPAFAAAICLTGLQKLGEERFGCIHPLGLLLQSAQT